MDLRLKIPLQANTMNSPVSTELIPNRHKEMILELSHKGCWRFQGADLRRENIPGLWSSLGKGTEVGDELTCMRNKKTSLPML